MFFLMKLLRPHKDLTKHFLIGANINNGDGTVIKTRTNLSVETDYHRNMVAVLKHDRSIINVYMLFF